LRLGFRETLPRPIRRLQLVGDLIQIKTVIADMGTKKQT
jgi:hypothetical protein